MDSKNKRARIDYDEVHSIKLTKCYICTKVSDNLIELPFEKYICDECIDYKCVNEFRSPDDVNQLIDLINPVSILIDQMQKQCRTPAANTNHLGMQLFKIKSRTDDLRNKIKNYEAKIRTRFDLIRMEIDRGYKRMEKQIDGWCQLSLYQLLEFSDQVRSNYERNEKEYNVMVESFLHQNAVYMSHLIGQIERYGYLDGYVLKKYENELNENLKNLALLPYMSKTVEFVAINNPDVSIGSIKVNTDTRLNSCNSGKVLSNSFSMNSILGIQSNESKSLVTGYKLKSVHSMLDNQNKDKFLIFYEWLDQSIKYKIAVYDQQGSKQSEIHLRDGKKIYAIGTDMISKVVICQKGETDSSAELCILEEPGLDMKRKVEFNLKENNVPIDVCFQNFIGVLMATGDQFKLVLFDLNLRMIHSIRIHVSQPRELVVKAKIVFKSNLACVMFSSSNSSFITCLDLITGRPLFQFQVNLTANTMLVCHNDEENQDDKLKIYNESNINELKIIFVSNNKFYLYDMSQRRVVFSTKINSITTTNTNDDLVTVNRKGELVRLNIY